MNPKRILLILAGLLAFTVGLVSTLHAQNMPPRAGVACSKATAPILAAQLDKVR